MPNFYHHFPETKIRKPENSVKKSGSIFFDFSKAKLKTNFITQSNVVLTFILCTDHNCQSNICWDIKFPKKIQEICVGTFGDLFLYCNDSNRAKVQQRLADMDL